MDVSEPAGPSPRQPSHDSQVRARAGSYPALLGPGHEPASRAPCAILTAPARLMPCVPGRRHGLGRRRLRSATVAPFS